MSAIDQLSLNGPCIRDGKDMPVSKKEKGRKSESDRSTQTVLVPDKNPSTKFRMYSHNTAEIRTKFGD